MRVPKKLKPDKQLHGNMANRTRQMKDECEELVDSRQRQRRLEERPEGTRVLPTAVPVVLNITLKDIN